MQTLVAHIPGAKQLLDIATGSCHLRADVTSRIYLRLAVAAAAARKRSRWDGCPYHAWANVPRVCVEWSGAMWSGVLGVQAVGGRGCRHAWRRRLCGHKGGRAGRRAARWPRNQEACRVVWNGGSGQPHAGSG